MRLANAVRPSVTPGLLAALLLALACGPKSPVLVDTAKHSPEVKPPEEPEPEPATIEQPDVGTPAEDEPSVDPHRVDELAAWTKDCGAIDRARTAEEMPPAKIKCPMTGDFDGDGKPDTIEIRVSKTGQSGLAVSWGNGSFSMLGGGRRVLLTGAALPTDPEDEPADEIFETMDWIADAKVAPLRDGKLQYKAGPRSVTVEGFESISGDALYISGDDAAALIYFDASGDHWRLVQLGF